MKVKDLIKTDMSLFGAEAGYDWLFKADEPTKIYAGVMLGYVDATDIKTEKENGRYEKGKGSSPSVGVYATVVNDENWFIDIAARNFWSSLEMKSHSNDSRVLTYEPKRDIIAGSIEIGKNIKREVDRKSYIRIEPKAELGVMRATGSEVDVNNGYKLKYDGANYANVKAGLLLSYNTEMENGLLIEPLVELAYRYELLGKDKVTYNGVREESDIKGGTIEIDAGLNMQLAENLYWYGVGSYEQSSKVSGWGVHAGIRYDIGGSSSNKKKAAANKKKKSGRPGWAAGEGRVRRREGKRPVREEKAAPVVEAVEEEIIAVEEVKPVNRDNREHKTRGTDRVVIKEKQEVSDEAPATGKDRKPKRYKVVNGEKIEQ